MLLVSPKRRAQLRASGKKWYTKKGKAYHAQWRVTHLEDCQRRSRENKARRRVTEKLACIAAYGGCCSCCGEPEIRFLTIDHIDGKGARHRRRLNLANKTGYDFYCWLKKQGYPTDNFRCLCYNCNCGRHWNKGICPHQEVRDAAGG